MVSSLRFVATCVPGAEKWVAKELTRLGVPVELSPGALVGRTTLPALRRILSGARLPESLRVRPIQAFSATHFDDLGRALGKLPWHAYLVPGRELEVRVTCRKSRLYHSDAVAERVLAVIRERTKTAWGVPAQTSINTHCNRVFVRLDHDEVEVGIDAAGEALHRRGYRKFVQDAPLRETLASLLLELALDAAKRPIERLWDPCCGSGTIPLEWLSTQLHQVPLRPFLMDEWPCFRQFADQASEAAPQAATLSPVAYGCDISEGAIAASTANARALGASERIHFQQTAFQQFVAEVPPNTGVVTNLPYGVRLETQNEAASLFASLDDILRRRPDLRPAVVLWGAGKRVPKLRNAWEVGLEFRNGGLPVTAFVLR